MDVNVRCYTIHAAFIYTTDVAIIDFLPKEFNLWPQSKQYALIGSADLLTF